jgi:type III restriction enzyme
MILDGAEVRDLDYETDVLSGIDWRDFDPEDLANRVPENAQAAESQLQRIRLSDHGNELIVGETVAKNTETLTFDPSHAVRLISDIVINPFVGREIVAAALRHLRGRGFDDARLGQLAGLIIEELRRGLNEARDARAEALFKAEVEAGRIQFRLRLDGRNWRMPFSVETSEPEDARKLRNRADEPLEKSLFSPIYENELNGDERDVAVYLDSNAALTWWHRNVARTQYGLQGWRRAKIYPDFIFAAHRDGESKRITILETKGDQLDNLDTAYKRDALSFLSDHFQWDDVTPVGELELVKTGETVRATLILMSKWKAELPAYL